jgi:hypothetical protein
MYAITDAGCRELDAWAELMAARLQTLHGFLRRYRALDRMEPTMWTTIAKWTRKVHGWLAIPLILAIVAVQAVLAPSLAPVAGRLQQVLMLTMAATGLFLYAYPRIKRSLRRRRAKH